MPLIGEAWAYAWTSEVAPYVAATGALFNARVALNRSGGDSLRILNCIIADSYLQYVAGMYEQALWAQHEQPDACRLVHLVSQLGQGASCLSVFLPPPVVFDITGDEQNVGLPAPGFLSKSHTR